MQIEIIGNRIKARFNDLTPVVFFSKEEAQRAADGLLQAVREMEPPQGLGINVSETVGTKSHMGK